MKERMHIQIEPKKYEILREIAYDRHISIAQLAREAIDFYLKKGLTDTDIPARLKSGG